MSPEYLASIWPGMANHLWQSTLFVIVAGLLTLLLRKNQARTRYWLWLAASVKFLIPFSLLVVIGSHLASAGSSAGMKPAFYVAFEEVSQPFAHSLRHSTMRSVSPAATSTTLPTLIHLLPAILAAVWFCGFIVVFLVCWAHWRRVSSNVQDAVPLRKGREVEALRRLEHIGGTRSQIEILLSRASLEPGVFGIFRSTLIWPKGISEHLGEAHLEAILAHELWHVRRRDNLAAAMHTIVEAIFWFHPLVWWLGARLVEERERACDEEVLQLGNEPQVYAESILTACKFCVSSPLTCVSGVTGADLKNRIVRIMTHRVAHKLEFGKKLLLGTVGTIAVAIPLVFGLLHTPQSRAESQSVDAAGIYAPAFAVASIKPNKSGDGRHFLARITNLPNDGRFYATGVTLKMLLHTAYDVEESQISGGPSWLSSDRYDIQAKADSSVDDALRKLSPEQGTLAKQRMLQKLLSDRFKLTLSHETKDLPVYTLVVAKNGPKLQESKDDVSGANGPRGPNGHLMRMERGQLNGQGVPIAFLVQQLSQQLGRNVVDKTGLKGNYDFTLQWTPDESRAAMSNGGDDSKQGADNTPLPDSSGPSLFTALQEQLGLKLESQKGPVEIIAIDHIEKPTEN
jgi:bla regulator protein blaR1